MWPKLYRVQLQANDSFVTALVGNTQLLAALAAAGRENSPPFNSRHALAKSMLIAALGIGGLIGPFHNAFSMS